MQIQLTKTVIEAALVLSHELQLNYVLKITKYYLSAVTKSSDVIKPGMGPVPNRGARAVAKKVCQTSGTDATGVAVARGNVKF